MCSATPWRSLGSAKPAAELHVESKFRAEHYPLAESRVEIEGYARHHPFSYDAAEVPDIGRTAERHYADARTSGR